MRSIVSLLIISIGLEEGALEALNGFVFEEVPRGVFDGVLGTLRLHVESLDFRRGLVLKLLRRRDDVVLRGKKIRMHV